MQHGEASHRTQTPFVPIKGLENESSVNANLLTLARWALNIVALPHWAPNKYQGKDKRVNWNVVLVPNICFEMELQAMNFLHTIFCCFRVHHSV